MAIFVENKTITMEKEKTGVSSVLAGVVSMLSVLMAMHYWFSYWYMYKKLALFDITPNPIISLEDVTFSYGYMSFEIFLLSFVLTSLVFSTHLFVDDLASLIDNFVNRVKLPSFSKKTRIVISISSVVVLGIIILWNIIPSLDITIKYPAFTLFTSLLVLGALSYFVFSIKRKVLLFTIICCNFIWGISFINIFFHNKEKYTLDNISMEISFTYNGNKVTTSDTLGLVFHGYRYYILCDTTKKCSYLYPTNAIENIEYKHIEWQDKSEKLDYK